MINLGQGEVYDLNATEKRKRVLDKWRREAGKAVLKALDDPEVIEIILKPDGRLRVDRVGVGLEDTGETMQPEMSLSMLGTVATLLDTVINREHPILEGELPDGSRIEGIIPPVSRGPTFAIRKKAERIFTLKEYVEGGRLTAKQRNIIEEAVLAKKNIVICGGTGSGKTTFGNAVLHFLAEACPNERAILIEDTTELQCSLDDTTALKTVDEEETKIDMKRLLRATLRLRPDRIIIGETRGGEALQLLKAWNTGHPGGLVTLHSDDAESALYRLEEMIQENRIEPSKTMIARTIDLIVFLARTPKEGPKIMEIKEVNGFKNGAYILNDIT